MSEKDTSYKYLSKINNTADLRSLSVDELPFVCEELRRKIIEVLSTNPGHLASSLGAVEITVALHYVFDTPNDQIVWDVGHQAYAHKILTGRRDDFVTNRKLHGLKPFPSPSESEYDVNTCGHASNSISIALGLSVASVMQGNKDKKVVAVIGDGAMSGGLAFEGLNNVSSTPNNMLIILNDNNMSIDRSVGGLKEYLLNLHTSSWYNKLRLFISRKFASVGYLSEKRKKAIIRFNNSLKSIIAHQQNIFEGLDIRYFGPANGHDVKLLVKTLSAIRDMDGPKMLHIHTVKGKGYEPAERDATCWHAPGKFNIGLGVRSDESQVEKEPKPLKYQEVFGKTLVELARNNKKIVGITPAMPSGCSMNIMQAEMPDRVFDVGIAEGHAVTFSAGLAKNGMVPFCNIYSSFSQRAYDNIIHDVAISNLPVVICLDRAGLVGEDGPTHHGAFDMAFLRTIPNLIIASPYDEKELRKLMFSAQLPGHGCYVIRYPRGKSENVDWKCSFEIIETGKGRKLKEGKDIAVITIGPIGNTATKAIEELEKENNVSIAHYDLRFVKPLDEGMLTEIAHRFKKIMTIEDGSLKGGVGSAVLEFMAEKGFEGIRIKCLGLPDNFVEHGPVADLHKIVGIDKDGIKKSLSEFI